MSEDIWLAVDGRLVRAHPITVYQPIEEEPTPPPVVEQPPKEYTSRFGVRYSDAQKASILAEANRPGAYVREVAKKYGVSPDSIYGWRRKSLKGKRLARKAS